MSIKRTTLQHIVAESSLFEIEVCEALERANQSLERLPQHQDLNSDVALDANDLVELKKYLNRIINVSNDILNRRSNSDVARKRFCDR